MKNNRIEITGDRIRHRFIDGKCIHCGKFYALLLNSLDQNQGDVLRRLKIADWLLLDDYYPCLRYDEYIIKDIIE